MMLGTYDDAPIVLPAGRERIAMLEGYGMPAWYVPGVGIPGVPFAQAPEGAAVAAGTAAAGIPASRAILLGVTSGVLVWFVTRWLDGKFTRR